MRIRNPLTRRKAVVKTRRRREGAIEMPRHRREDHLLWTYQVFPSDGVGRSWLFRIWRYQVREIEGQAPYFLHQILECQVDFSIFLESDIDYTCVDNRSNEVWRLEEQVLVIGGERCVQLRYIRHPAPEICPLVLAFRAVSTSQAIPINTLVE